MHASAILGPPKKVNVQNRRDGSAAEIYLLRMGFRQLLGEINLPWRREAGQMDCVLRVQVKKKQRENGCVHEERDRESARFNERAASRHAELFDPVIGASESAAPLARPAGCEQ